MFTCCRSVERLFEAFFIVEDAEGRLILIHVLGDHLGGVAVLLLFLVFDFGGQVLEHVGDVVLVASVSLLSIVNALLVVVKLSRACVIPLHGLTNELRETRNH